MNLSDLSGYWNTLRNAALGSGVASARVSPALASQVETSYAAWRAYYVAAGPLAHLGLDEEGSNHQRRYITLRVALAKEGVLVDEIPAPTIDRGLDVVVNLASPETLKRVFAAGAFVFLTPIVATVIIRIWGERRR